MEAEKGWPIRSDYFFDAGWNCVHGIAGVGNTRAKSSPTTYSRFCNRRLESPPRGLFQAFLGCAEFKAEVGAALPESVTEAERNTAVERSAAE